MKECQDLLTYFLEYVINNLLIPGQVENWVLIADMSGLNVTSVPYSVCESIIQMFSEIFKFMQNNYRARLYKGYILNAPWTFSAVWTVVKQFIEETTAMKIVITSSSTDAKIKTHVSTEQLETKYGGEEDNLTQFWPPKLNRNDVWIAGDIPSKILSN